MTHEFAKAMQALRAADEAVAKLKREGAAPSAIKSAEAIVLWHLEKVEAARSKVMAGFQKRVERRSR